MLNLLGEAKAKTGPEKLTGIPARRLPQAQQAALMRVHLYLIGKTHELLNDFTSKARATILEYAGEDGILDAGEAARAQQALLAGWQESYMDKWLPLFQALRKEAASIPFGALAVEHEKRFSPQRTQRSQRNQGNLGEAKASPVFDPQLQALIDAANMRLYGDGLTLSTRIWKLDRETRQGINRVLMDAIVNGRSAWDTAKDLESFLGANQDCPRWTSTRLYKLSKKDIASGVRTGLKTGEECQGQGVAYKALRLARNEIQVVHHEASDKVMAAQPWVEKEQIVLSPQHPVPDICDEIIAAGEGGKGIYPVGEVVLPLHPQCVVPGQFVETQRGRIPIEQVRLGDLVITHAGRFKPVIAVWERQYDGAVYVVKTANGQIELTDNHPVLLQSGWVDAQFVKPGDQVVYAGSDIGADIHAGISKNMPADLCEMPVAASVPLGVSLMPANPIAFDCDLGGDNSKVDEIETDSEFSLVRDTCIIEGMLHDHFQLRGICESPFSECQEHRHESGVASTLGDGYLPGNLGALRRTSPFDMAHGFFQLLASFFSTCGVAFPGYPDSFANAAHGNIAQGEQLAQNPVSNPVAPEYLRSTKFLNEIDVIQEILERDTVFGFEAECMEFDYRKTMRADMGVDNSSEALTTNRASNHNNLLSLSPENMQWGVGSGNPVVGELARPTQALPHYTRVEEVAERPYSGFVYNLSVLDDNSYTVNGHAVHNCLCFKITVMQPEKEFIDRLRSWMGGGSDSGMDEYAAFIGARNPQHAATASLMNDVVAQALGVWLFGGKDQIEGRLGL